MGAYISRHGSVPEGHGRRLARSLLQMREEGGDKKHDGTVLDVAILVFFFIVLMGHGFAMGILSFKIKRMIDARHETPRQFFNAGKNETLYVALVKDEISSDTGKAVVKEYFYGPTAEKGMLQRGMGYFDFKKGGEATDGKQVAEAMGGKQAVGHDNEKDGGKGGKKEKAALAMKLGADPGSVV